MGRNRNSSDGPTPRELDVLRLLALGYTGKQIAGILVISARTVQTHRSNLMGKFSLSGYGQLANLLRLAREQRFLNGSGG